MNPLLTCMKSQIKLLLFAAFLTLFTCAATWAQERKVTGTVKSAEDNSPMPGVNVVVKGKTAGTITDISGNYSISVTGSDATLVFSFIGFNSQEIAVGSQSSINVSMTTSATQLGRNRGNFSWYKEREESYYLCCTGCRSCTGGSRPET